MRTTELSPPGRVFTGRAFLVWLILGFALVLGVNAAMAYLAVRSFNGVEVKSSYAAGRAMPAELRAAAAQNERGWIVDLHIDGRARKGEPALVWATLNDRTGEPLEGLSTALRLEHPSDEFLDRSVVLTETARGRYAGTVELGGAVAWTAELVARRDGEVVFKSRNRLRLDVGR